jgi:hypothetical protein
MPEFSLVVATKDWTSELVRLIASIGSQSDPDYELIPLMRRGSHFTSCILSLCIIDDKLFRMRIDCRRCAPITLLCPQTKVCDEVGVAIQ